ncbi:MAG: HIT family protein [Ahrensia sp.]
MGLNRLLLMNDKRFPWLILVPQRADIKDFDELSPLDQTMMTFEMGEISRALKAATGCYKINIAALGNMVPQLHMHVIARNTDDAAWPKPVWGVGEAQAYTHDEANQVIAGLMQHL